MEPLLAALADSSRWRLVELLAERPRSVGELAQLTGLRQPQTTKHLQTLARAGLVAVFPLGQRRVYALEPAPVREVAVRLGGLAETVEAQGDDRNVLARYRAAIEAESALADRDRWADGRTFSFERELPAPREVVWRHWIEPDLLASWWAPQSMTVTDCVLEPVPGGRAVLEYSDADGRYRSEGSVRAVDAPRHLVFDLSVPGPTDAASFTGSYDVSLDAADDGTRLRVALRITDSVVEAAPSIAGIGTGWGQVLDNLARVLPSTHDPSSAAADLREETS